MKYVAYGSNLNIEQMKRRCPTATIVSSGYLNDYTLSFKGSKTGAYATVEKRKGDRVPVVVWEIQKSDEDSLDIYEGFPVFYKKKKVHVTLKNNKIMPCMIYVMREDAKYGIPSRQYVRTCARGYIDNDLDLSEFTRFISSCIERRTSQFNDQSDYD